MLEFAYHAYKDPAMTPYLPTRTSWESVQFGRTVGEHPEPPPQASVVFPGTGHAILRTDGDAALAAAVTFGPYGGFHGHFDKLSFVFFGRGHELGVDPGRAASQAYRLPIHRQWYKATIGHNAVLVDGQSQAPAAGVLAAFAANKQYSAVVARCNEAYKGVEHRRLLCLTPAYLLVFDDLRAETPRRFDWLYHNRGSAAECEAVAQQDPRPPAAPGWEYIENVRFGATDGPIRVRFPGDKVSTHLTMAPATGTELRTGDGVGKSVVDRVPLVAVGRRGQHVQFAAVLEPVKQNGTPAVGSVTSVKVERLGDAFLITVDRGDASDTITLGDRDTIEVRSGDRLMLSSDGAGKAPPKR
jgi:oligo-alginate lyase